MPESGGSKDTEAGAAGASGQRKRRAGEDTGSSSSSSSGAVKIEGGQRKRRAGGGAGQELPGRVMMMSDGSCCFDRARTRGVSYYVVAFTLLGCV